jgi:hypothetical protein
MDASLERTEARVEKEVESESIAGDLTTTSAPLTSQKVISLSIAFPVDSEEEEIGENELLNPKKTPADDAIDAENDENDDGIGGGGGGPTNRTFQSEIDADRLQKQIDAANATRKVPEPVSPSFLRLGLSNTNLKKDLVQEEWTYYGHYVGKALTSSSIKLYYGVANSLEAKTLTIGDVIQLPSKSDPDISIDFVFLAVSTFPNLSVTCFHVVSREWLDSEVFADEKAAVQINEFTEESGLLAIMGNPWIQCKLFLLIMIFLSLNLTYK